MSIKQPMTSEMKILVVNDDYRSEKICHGSS